MQFVDILDENLASSVLIKNFSPLVSLTFKFFVNEKGDSSLLVCIIEDSTNVTI
jgi:hypothetical protein